MSKGVVQYGTGVYCLECGRYFSVDYPDRWTHPDQSHDIWPCDCPNKDKSYVIPQLLMEVK